MALLLTPVLGSVDLRNRVVLPRQNDLAVQKRCEFLLKSSSGVVAVRVRKEFLGADVPQLSSEVRDMILDRLVSFRADGYIDFVIDRKDCPIERRSIPIETVRFERTDKIKVVSIRAALKLLDNSVGRYILEECEVPDIYGGSFIGVPEAKSSLPNSLAMAHAQNQRAVESAEQLADLRAQLKAAQMQIDRIKINEAAGPVEPAPVPSAAAAPIENATTEPAAAPDAPPPPRAARGK